MLDQTGNSVFNNTSNLGSAEPGQLLAALTLALKGKLLMHCPCPKCDRAKVLFEKILSDGARRHECRSCGYLMVWHTSDRDVHEQVNPNSNRIERYNREAFARRIHPDK